MGASQRAVPWWLRAYLLLNAVQDLGLALNGLLAPDRYDLTFPLTVTPLNGRFIGALYLAAGVGIILSACAREPAEARIFVVGFGVVSLLALIVTVWYWREFTMLGRPTTWLFTYSVDPPLAVFTLWRLRLWRPAVPAYHRLSPLFIAECALLGSIGLVLLAAPQLATKAWPWVINIPTARLYSAFFLGFAVGALLAVREASVPAIRPITLSSLALMVLLPLATSLHLPRFRPGWRTWLWFGSFGAGTFAFLGALAVLPWRREGRQLVAETSATSR